MSNDDRPAIIRVGVLLGTFSVGGAELQMVQLLERMDRDRFLPFAISLRNAGVLEGRIRESGIEIVSLNLSRRKPFVSMRDAVSILRDLHLDVLYCVLAGNVLIGSFLGKLARVRKIVAGLRGLGMTWSRRQIWEIRLARCLVDSYIVNSGAIGRIRVEREWIDPSKMEVIPNGLDLSRFRFNAEKRDEIGIIGTLKDIKGQREFIRAARLLVSRGYKLHFVVVGGGPDRSALEAMVQDLGMERLFAFTGQIDNVADYVGRLRVLVSASFFEGMSNVILEAMSSGTPVVVSDVPSNNEVVEHMRTGLLYQLGNETELAESIAFLLDHPEVYKRIQTDARRMVEQRFSMSEMVELTQAHFLRLIGDVRGR